MQITLTKESILADIDKFQYRVSDAERKLFELPKTATSFRDRKKIKKARRKLLYEIEHVNRMASYAREALAELQ